jgi:hypothetical protein
MCMLLVCRFVFVVDVSIDEFAEDGARMVCMAVIRSVMRFTSNKGSRRPLALSEGNLSALASMGGAHAF